VSSFVLLDTEMPEPCPRDTENQGHGTGKSGGKTVHSVRKVQSSNLIQYTFFSEKSQYFPGKPKGKTEFFWDAQLRFPENDAILKTGMENDCKIRKKP
jgi:hypothetical protein